MMVAKYCNNCETEIKMRWDTKTMGYKAFCPVCGERLMLCDECQHRGSDGKYMDDCDYYDNNNGTCRFNKTPHQRAEQYQRAEQWISVEDRLPEKSGVYLVCMHGGYVTVLEYSELHKRFNCTLKVTHWMTLPEPPEESEEET